MRSVTGHTGADPVFTKWGSELGVKRDGSGAEIETSKALRSKAPKAASPRNEYDEGECGDDYRAARYGV